MKIVKTKWKDKSRNQYLVQEKNRKSFAKEISVWTNIRVSVR